jgi:hypothetical protein
MRKEELRRISGIEDAAKAARRLKWRWGRHGPGEMGIRHKFRTRAEEVVTMADHDVDETRNLEKL